MTNLAPYVPPLYSRIIVTNQKADSEHRKNEFSIVYMVLWCKVIRSRIQPMTRVDIMTSTIIITYTVDNHIQCVLPVT